MLAILVQFKLMKIKFPSLRCTCTFQEVKGHMAAAMPDASGMFPSQQNVLLDAAGLDQTGIALQELVPDRQLR